MINVHKAILLLFVLLAANVWGQVKAPPETRNAALRYWQAFAELKDPPADASIQAEIEKTLSGEAGWYEAKLGPIVAANEVALGIMQRATRLPECDWGVEYSRGPEASSAFIPRAHVLARLNTLWGMRELNQGQAQAAVDTWLAGIRFAQDLTKGGSLIFVLTAKSVLSQEMHSITAGTAQLNAAQKRQLYDRVNALPEDVFEWSRAWEMDEVGTDLFFEEMQRSDDPAHLYESLMGSNAPKDCIPPNEQQVRLYHAYMRDVTYALRLPPSVAKQRVAGLDGKQKTICETIRATIPSANRVNDARAEMVDARKSLLKALKAN